MSKVVLVNFDKKSYKKFLLNEIGDNIESIINIRLSNLENTIKLIIKDAIIRSDEMTSLNDGLLGAILGIENGTGGNIANIIANTVANSLQIKIVRNKVVGNRTGLILKFSIVKADYKDVLGLSVAKYISTNLDGNNTLIPWLSWLLTFGDNIIIANYKVSFGYFKDSRSKKAIMVSLNKSKANKFKNKFKQGSVKKIKLKRPKIFGTERGDSGNDKMGWRIPPRFSGTVDNNFILRAINNNAISIIKAIKNVLDL